MTISCSRSFACARDTGSHFKWCQWGLRERLTGSSPVQNHLTRCLISLSPFAAGQVDTFNYSSVFLSIKLFGYLPDQVLQSKFNRFFFLPQVKVPFNGYIRQGPASQSLASTPLSWLSTQLLFQQSLSLLSCGCQLCSNVWWFPAVGKEPPGLKLDPQN